MHVGLMLQFMNPDRIPDEKLYKGELELAVAAEEAGFDSVWSPEHHFADYSIAPDPLQIVTWIGARTKTIKVGTAAVILPWYQQPIRIAERFAMLDAMTEGRCLVGFGRGLAPKEFAPFGVPVGESRERFDEMSRMIVDALESGEIQGNGPFFPQQRTPIRPRPTRSFKDRLYVACQSQDSMVGAAKLGARTMSFAQHDQGRLLPMLEAYRETYTEIWNEKPKPILFIDDCFCDEDSGRAEETARRYFLRKYIDTLDFYQLLKRETYAKGYEEWEANIVKLGNMPLEEVAEAYMINSVWGTPQQVIDKVAARRELIGDYEWVAMLTGGGLPHDLAKKSMDLMAKEVLPEIKSW